MSMDVHMLVQCHSIHAPRMSAINDGRRSRDAMRSAFVLPPGQPRGRGGPSHGKQRRSPRSGTLRTQQEDLVLVGRLV